MKKVILFLKKEILELIPPTIFFYIAFSVPALMRNLAANQYGIILGEYDSTLLAALIVAKSILIVDMMSFAKKVGRKYLIVNVIWKIFLNMTVIVFFSALEKYIPLISEYGSISEAGRYFADQIVWSRFWNAMIIHVLFLTIYGSTVAMINKMGRRSFINLLLGPTDGINEKAKEIQRF